MKPTLYAGTIGQSVWRSTDNGDTWRRASNELFPEADVRAIAVNPSNSDILYAGTEKGIFRSDNAAESWHRLSSPMDESEVWAITIDRKTPNTLYAGTCPSALFKSTDGGTNWEQLNADLAQECEGVPIIPRVTTFVVDPEDSQTLYAGVEIDGMHLSTDGGETWVERSEGLSSLDIHGLCVVPGSPKTIIAATNNDVCVTTDMGQQWTPLNVKAHYPWPYCRAAFFLNGNAGRVFIGAGNGPPGDQGGIFSTLDAGKTWNRADIGRTANSTIWCFAHNPQFSDLLIACSVSGQLYRSTDSGNSWTKLDHEFGEVRALAIG